MALQDIWTDIRPMHNCRRSASATRRRSRSSCLERIISVLTVRVTSCSTASRDQERRRVAAERLGRRWIANDAGKLAIYLTQRRLLPIRRQPMQALRQGQASTSPQPFDLCSPGCTTTSCLKISTSRATRRFCLDFRCRPGAIQDRRDRLCGRRKGEPVHFSRSTLAPELADGREYLESLYERLKGKVSGAVFVIVPITHCDPGLFADVFPLEDNPLLRSAGPLLGNRGDCTDGRSSCSTSRSR